MYCSNLFICLFPVPGAPKIRPQANSDLSDSLNVTWGKPENPNGVLTGYTLYWEKQDEEILTVSGKVTVHDGRICQYLITNLSKVIYFHFHCY